ncbi:MAG: FAD-binding protein [Pseudomonadota bacterium]
MTQFTSNIAEPLQVDGAEALDWDNEADIVVVGFGGAGVCAALEGRERGASVIALDRFAGGGATANSGGVVYAGGTEVQADAGFSDSADNMFNYLNYEGTPVSEQGLRAFCNSSADNIRWLQDKGVQFESTVYERRTAYPPDGFHLYYTGMEKFNPEVATPAPRGHRTVGKGASGKQYFEPLLNSARDSGVEILPHCPARRLIIDSKGRVLGVEAQALPESLWREHAALYQKVDPMKPFNSAKAEDYIAQTAALEAGAPDKRIRLRAHKGLILASGGYNYNLGLYGQFRPDITSAAADLVRGGSMGCDGSGIELGMTAGGALDCMGQVFLSKALSPPEAFSCGLLVGQDGARLINEDAYLGNVGNAIAQQGEGRAWVVLDSSTFWQGVRQLLWPISNALSWWGMPALMNIIMGGTKRATTIDSLAAKTSIDASALEQSLARYNSLAANGKDADFGKQSVNLVAQNRAPYYAVNMSLRNKYAFSGSMPYGGLTVDEATGGVTRANGSVIEGLYAAGRTAVGICSGANFSGLSIADTVYSGRRAAKAALSNS